MSPFNDPSIFNSASTTGAGNCNPRQPAAFFEVKKDGPTKGKWFYTCQSKQCRMFLWKEKAVGRESQVLLSNNRSEAEPFKRPVQNLNISRKRETSVANKDWIQNLGKKDKSLEDDDSDEFGVSREDEQDLVGTTTRPSSGLSNLSSPETPRKAIKKNQFATPGSKRKRDQNFFPTPQTLDHLSPTLTKSRRGRGMSVGNELHPFTTPTPTPRRFPEESAQTSIQQSYEISDQVMELLKDQKLDHGVQSDLRSLLGKHDLRVSGILKGREAIRINLKNKEETIAELKQRISALEADQGMNKSIIKHLNDSLTTSISAKNSRAA